MDTDAKLMPPAEEKDRVSAAELVDYFLYWYAILHFLMETAFSPDTFAINGSVSATSILVILFFIFVLLRNYLVMHAIDTAERRNGTAFDFLRGNQGVADFLERMVRFAIMLTVIVTPKGAFGWANSVVNWVVHALSSAFIFICRPGGLPHAYGAQSIIHDALPYYCGVLFLLFVEFLAWDLICVCFFAVKVRERKISIEVDLRAGTVEDANYRSVLRYCNVCRRYKRATGTSMLFAPRYLGEKAVAKISEGRVLWLYLRSPKFLERLFGMLTAFLVLAMSMLEMPPLIVVAASISAFFYGFNAFQNEMYVRGMWGHVRYPLSYMLGGKSPFA